MLQVLCLKKSLFLYLHMLPSTHLDGAEVHGMFDDIMIIM